MEQIYSLNNPALVAPVSFIKNVLQYQASKSRVCDMNGLVGPFGSYTRCQIGWPRKALSQYHSVCLTAS